MADPIEGQGQDEVDGKAAAAAPVIPIPEATFDWKSLIPEDLKAEKSLETIKDVPAMVRSFIEAQKMVGGSIRLPKDDSPVEERQKFVNDILTKLKAPETPEGYDLTFGELPEGTEWDNDLVAWFRNTAHQFRLLPEQAKGIVAAQIQFEAERSRAERDEVLKGIAELQKEWGPFSNENFALADQALKHYSGADYEQVFNLLKKTGVYKYPSITRFLHRVGLTLPEDQFREGKMVGAETKESLQAKINLHQNDLTSKYHTGSDAERKQIGEEILQWRRAIATMEKRK
jgi:hypothetical protein